MRFWILISILCFSSGAGAFRVVIDPGHGGIDAGAVRGSLRESDIVLKVATRLRDLLERESGTRATLTRETDRAVSLPERIQRADEAGADLFVSLHANASPEGKAKGIELFFQNTLAPDEDALFLANLENQAAAAEDESIADISRKGDVAAIVADLHRQSRILSSLGFSRILGRSMGSTGAHVAIKQAPLYVVSKTKMPSVLVELGFLSHKGEAKKLATADYQDLLAGNLKEAILRYRQKMHRPGLGTNP